MKRLVWAGATFAKCEACVTSPRCAIKLTESVFSDHTALVEFNLCCFGGRRTPGHPLQAFGSSAYDFYRRQIESYLVPCAPAKKFYFRPLASARKTLSMLMVQWYDSDSPSEPDLPEDYDY